MKKFFLLPVMLLSCVAASAQFNLQLHYDLGRQTNPDAEAGRQLFTVTAEYFKADKLGSTYLFVDMDYRGKGIANQGAVGAYWEMGRDFTFLESDKGQHSVTAHVEYDGGLNNGGSFQQAALVGPAWQWHSPDFSRTFTLQVMYKQFFQSMGCDALSSFQITPVWGMTFAKNLLTFSGFADLWYGYIPKFDENGQKKGLVFLTEPQLWVNVYGKDRQNNKLSVGTEFEISNNFVWSGTDRSIFFNPTVAVKYTF